MGFLDHFDREPVSTHTTVSEMAPLDELPLYQDPKVARLEKQFIRGRYAAELI